MNEASIDIGVRVHEERPLWERLPGEPAVWFARFAEWLRQDHPRSLLALYKQERERKRAKKSDKTPLPQIKTSPAPWATAKVTYQWIARAKAWDQSELERKNREWAEAREDERQEELHLAQALRKLAREMLELPILAEVIKHDRDGIPTDFLLIPEYRAFKTASDMLGQAKNHARAALQMPDKFERNEVTGTEGGPVEVEDVGSSPEERLGRLLALVKQVTATHSGKGEEEQRQTRTRGKELLATFANL